MTTNSPSYEVDGDLEKKAPALADAIRSGSVPETILKHAHDADEAMKAFEGHAGQVIHIDEATNKRLCRLIDWNLMPIMCTIYGLQFLDKTTLSYASIMGLQTDINLVGDNYQWLGSMFYFGYLVSTNDDWLLIKAKLCQKRPVLT